MKRCDKCGQKCDAFEMNCPNCSGTTFSYISSAPTELSTQILEVHPRKSTGIEGVDVSPIIGPRSIQSRANSMLSVFLFVFLAFLVAFLFQKINSEYPSSSIDISASVSMGDGASTSNTIENPPKVESTPKSVRTKISQDSYLQMACSSYLAKDIEGMWRYFPRLLIGDYKNVAEAGMWIADSMAGLIMGSGSDVYTQNQLGNSYTVILDSFCRE